MTRQKTTERALEGIRVLEYCDMVAGPYCGKLLADLGAETIKVEEPPAGDRARRRGPFPNDIPHPEKSGLFLYLNTNKLGVTLNVRTATGREIFRRLAQEADVLIEDRPPGQMRKWGLGYKALSALNPQLIMASLTPFGQDGPYRDYKCHTLNLHHCSGHSTQFFMARYYEPGREPLPPGGYVGEYDSGLNTAIAVIAALLGRFAIGEGQQIDVSKQETLLGLERVDVSRFADASDAPARMGMPVGGLLACKDGYVILVMPQDHQWQGLISAMGNPQWAQREEYDNELSRAQHIDEIQPHVEEWVGQFGKEELYHLAQGHNVPLAPVRSPADVFNWQQPQQRGFFAEIEHPRAGRLSYPTVSYKYSETPWRAERAAPLLGEHNEEVYCRRLGYSRQELARLAAAGIV
jgi:CoA:oxalate CoA-transferase